MLGLCFRAWPLRDRLSLERTIDKAVALCRYLLQEAGRELVFISTCQGIDGYIDDSDVALEITSHLTESERARCRVDRLRRSPRDLIAELSRLDAFLGMRLHACMLSMLGGTPAMGIGYESKTEQMYGQLGLSDHQVAFDSDYAEWEAAASGFLARQTSLRAGLAGALDAAAALAGDAIDSVVDLLDERAVDHG